jgi:hypothetical protein
MFLGGTRSSWRGRVLGISVLFKFGGGYKVLRQTGVHLPGAFIRFVSISKKVDQRELYNNTRVKTQAID